MTEESDNWLEVYDELGSMVVRSKHQTFQHNLGRWFAWIDEQPAVANLIAALQVRKDFQSWYDDCKTTVRSMVGSGKLKWPSNNEDRIGLQISLFRAFATGSVRVTDFTTSFLYSNNNFNVMVADVVEQLFEPLSRELRRYASRALSEPAELWSGAVPASDRIVPLNHNSPEYAAINRDLEKLEEAIRGNNDYLDDADKSQRVAEVGAMRRLLSATRVRVDALISLVVRGLQHVAQIFVDTVIGTLALGALALLGRMTGLW